MKILHVFFGETVHFKCKYFEIDFPFGGYFLLFFIYFIIGISIFARGAFMAIQGAVMMIGTGSFFFLIYMLILQVYKLFFGN